MTEAGAERCVRLHPPNRTLSIFRGRKQHAKQMQTTDDNGRPKYYIKQVTKPTEFVARGRTAFPTSVSDVSLCGSTKKVEGACRRIAMQCFITSNITGMKMMR